ncbi:MAG: hypothetical protein ACE5KY_06345, partial [Candidatus Tectimicrobiota bacterium]
RYLGKPKGEVLEFFVTPLAAAPFGPPPDGWDPQAAAPLKDWLAEEGPAGLAERLRRDPGDTALIPPALALLSERMLALHRDGPEAEGIAEADEAIDRLVGRLFGLSPAEEALAAEAAWASRERGADREKNERAR